VEDSAGLLAELTRRLTRTPARAPLPLRLCMAYVDIVAAVGGAITLGDGPERVRLCATDDSAAHADDAQDVLRQGPSMDAFRTGAAVAAASTEEQDRRWPLLGELLHKTHADLLLHAFPMRFGAETVGVLLVHRSDQDELGATSGEAQFLADAVGAAVLGDLGPDSVSEDSWSTRDKIDQATGMVIAQLGIAPPDALAVLRSHAFAHSTTLAEVSGWILERRLDFSDRNGTDGSTS